MAEINISYFYIVITNFFVVISIIFHDIIISNNTLMMNIFSMLEEKYFYQRRSINLFDELKTNFHSMDKQKIQESTQKIQFIQIFNLSFNWEKYCSQIDFISNVKICVNMHFVRSRQFLFYPRLISIIIQRSINLSVQRVAKKFIYH